MTTPFTGKLSQCMRRAFWMLAGLLLCCMVTPSSAAESAAEIDCAKMLARTAAQNYGKDAIAKAQKQLAALGFNPEMIDGMLGFRTRAALKAFCDGAEFARSDDLFGMLSSHAAIHRAYPDWTRIMASEGFVKWAQKQPDAAEIQKVKSSGNSIHVIQVLDRYRRHKSYSPVSRNIDDLLYSYNLGESDFKMLASGEEVLKRIGKLKGKSYANMDEFDSALKGVLSDVPEPERYMRAVLPYARAQEGLMLTAESVKQLKVGNVPSYILDALKELDGLNYQGRTLEGAVETAVGKATKKIMGLKPQIIKLAEIAPSGAKFTAASLSKFAVAQDKDAQIAAAVMERLWNMQDVEYQSDKSMASAVENVLMQEVEHADSFLPLITGSAEEVAAYGLDGADMPKIKEELEKFSIPGIYLEMLADLKEADYPEGELFWLAAEAKVSLAGGNNVNKQIIFGVIEEHDATMLDDDLLGKMKDNKLPPAILAEVGKLAGIRFSGTTGLKDRIEEEVLDLDDESRQIIFGAIERRGADMLDEALLDEMKENGLMPNILDVHLRKLAGMKFNGVKALEYRIEKHFRKLNEEMGQYKPLILAQARKKHEFDKSGVIRWDGESCNCVHNNLAGEVYGFYPYWLAEKKPQDGSPAPIQKMDFSVLTRMEYYALGFDDKGGIPSAARWEGLDAEFVEEARRYGTKVDLVIQRDDWKTWGELDAAKKAEAFNELAGNISRLLDIPLGGFAKVKPYLSLGMHPRSVMGDGVTLYFEDYPDDEESAMAFAGLVRLLDDKLGVNGKRKKFVNIMFRSRNLGKGIYEYHRLRDYMEILRGDGAKRRGNLLVLLEEPTTYDKKTLRQNIENGLHGKDRMRLLRDIVMVLTYDGFSKRQLLDDVVYANDNFGGIGFWPQPLATGETKAADGAISKTLHANFLHTLSGSAAAKPAVCSLVCPNRWAFRIAWDISILLLLATLILYATQCTWRSLLEANFLRFIAFVVAPFFLLTLAMLFCDPSWEDLSRDNGLAILMGVGIVAYAIWSYHDRKRKASMP